jgi:hypothetical protein
MNAIDHNFGALALVRYGDAEVKVIRKGDYVLCAVSGKRIPLDRLRYWSVPRQEAYAGPEIALQRWRELGGL